MKYLFLVVTMLFLSSPSQASSPVISVGKCKINELKFTKDWGSSGLAIGAYYNYSFKVVTCNEPLIGMLGEVEAEDRVIDLDFFEDNDVRYVTQNLKVRCEMERERVATTISRIHRCNR